MPKEYGFLTLGRSSFSPWRRGVGVCFASFGGAGMWRLNIFTLLWLSFSCTISNRCQLICDKTNNLRLGYNPVTESGYCKPKASADLALFDASLPIQQWAVKKTHKILPKQQGLPSGTDLHLEPCRQTDRHIKQWTNRSETRGTFRTFFLRTSLLWLTSSH